MLVVVSKCIDPAITRLFVKGNNARFRTAFWIITIQNTIPYFFY